MSHPRIKMLLAIGIAIFVFSSCSKKFSSDTPLPSVYPPSVIIGSDNGVLYGYNYTNGLQNWSVSFPLSSSIYASPLLYHGYVYVGLVNYQAAFNALDTLYKINSSTGAMTSKFVIPGPPSFSIMATPVADANMIFLATTNDSLYAIDTGSGKVYWRFGGTGSIISSPTVYSGSVYFATMGGAVYSLNETNGTLNWSASPVNYLGNAVAFQSSISVSAPYLYVGSNVDSNMYCFFLNPLTPTGTPSTTGIVRWTYKTKDEINSSPAAGDAVCVFGSNDHNIYCLDTATGLPNWVYSTASNVNSSPVIDNSKVYIGSNDYNLYALNILDGTVVWKQSTNGLIKSSPLVHNGTVYVGSYDKYFYAFNAASGSLIWSTNVNGPMECSPTLEDYSGVQYNSQVSGFTNFQ